MNSIETFRALAKEPEFKGWRMVGEPKIEIEIPFFGQVMDYTLETGNGYEKYYSILRQFGWSVCFGVNTDNKVITLAQWKPGVNQISWELPPGGIGKVPSGTPIKQITSLTESAFLKETGYGGGKFEYLGYSIIESGKYRGPGPNDHGLPAHLFLATDLIKVQDSRKPNKNEIMRTIEVPINEFYGILDSEEFNETSAVNCAFKALRRLKI